MKSDSELIEEFILTHGVTKCPPAAAAATTADIAPLARLEDPTGNLWRKTHWSFLKKKMAKWKYGRKVKHGRRVKKA